ncbi:[Fe-Fe] hydrogenase large subunit C-terminal domain-containing protein, partial [Desulfobacterales bacterium HSG2]|nr:[Fe-Fe] hydrogenase large subunit C-terminal domain-containing protein [Desulfobacterales bacterium HSG2]
CGECLRVCPTGAVKAATSGLDSLEADQISVVLVSPVLYSQFPGATPEDVLQGLRQMGFRHAVDMSYFLEMFQRAAEEFIVRSREDKTVPRPLISPICPVVVRLIAVQFPSLLPHILPIMRPVSLMTREVNRQIIREYGEEEKSVVLYYINPCPSKMDAYRLSFHHERPYVDKALGINDVYAELGQQLKKTEMPARSDIFDYKPVGSSLIWGISGGEILDMNIDCSLAVSGLKETISYLEKIEMGLFQNMEYIEFRTCPEGCVGGTLIGIDKYLAKNVVEKMARESGYERRVSRDEILRDYEKGEFLAKVSLAKMARVFSVRETPLSIESLMEIENILEQIQGMDCAVCGAPDCRTFAEDVVRGKASLSDCMLLRAHGEVRTEE